jgi:membrane associated rhomboid family serine protease
MTRLHFLIFYLLCGLAAALLQVFAEPASAVPMVGASGAISGVWARTSLCSFGYAFTRLCRSASS